MTEEQKDILIAKMLDAPASLSDEELDTIVNDDELKDIYDMSAAVSGACIRQPEPDMAKEWELFRPRIRRYHSPWRWVMRVAAIFSVVVSVSGIVVNLIDRLFTPDTPIVIAKVEQPAKKETVPASISEVHSHKSESAESICKPSDSHKRAASGSCVAKADNVRHKKQTSDEHQLQETASEIDVEEYLRIQKAKVDNELAMQQIEIQTEIYSGQHRMLMQMLDVIENDCESDIIETNRPDINDDNKVIML